MDVSIERDGTSMTVSVEGRIDGHTVIGFEQDLDTHLDDDVTRLILDMAAVDYISSAGLRVILVLTRQLDKRGGKLVLCGLDENVREIFRISGFDRIVAIADDREAAEALLS